MFNYFKSVLGMAAVLALLGQGCVLTERTDVSAPRPSTEAGVDAEVDAAVNAVIEEEEAAAQADANGSAEADAFGNNEAELDSYTKIQYEME